jgi:hypothetical protein
MRNLLASSGVSLIVLITLLGFAQAQVPLLPAPGAEPPDPGPLNARLFKVGLLLKSVRASMR